MQPTRFPPAGTPAWYAMFEQQLLVERVDNERQWRLIRQVLGLLSGLDPIWDIVTTTTTSTSSTSSTSSTTTRTGTSTTTSGGGCGGPCQWQSVNTAGFGNPPFYEWVFAPGTNCAEGCSCVPYVGDNANDFPLEYRYTDCNPV